VADNIKLPTKGDEGAVSPIIATTDESSVHFQRIILAGSNGSSLINVDVLNRKLRTLSLPYTYGISKDIISGHEPITIMGYNVDVDSIEEDIWAIGGRYIPPTAAMQLEVTSDSAEDDSGTVTFSGTADTVITSDISNNEGIITLTDASKDFTAGGAPVVAGDKILLMDDIVLATVTNVTATVLTASTTHIDDVVTLSAIDYNIIDISVMGTGTGVICLHYLDENYVEHSEYVILDGTNVVTTTAINILRVNHVHSIIVGTTGFCVGNIDVRHLTNTPIYRRMITGTNSDQDSFYTVPAGKILYITNVQVSSGYTTNFRLTLTKLLATVSVGHHYRAPGIFMRHKSTMTQDTNTNLHFEMPLKMPAKTDIKMASRCPESNAIVSVSYIGWLELV